MDLKTFRWLETYLDVFALFEYIMDTLPLLAENFLNSRRKSSADIVLVSSKWTALVTAQVKR